MKVAARKHLTGIREDQRIVGSAVDFDLENSSRVCQRVPDGAVHLRHAPQRIGILHPRVDGMVAMRFANLAALDQLAKSPCALHLARVRPHRLNLVVKSYRRSLERLQRHCTSYIGGIRQSLRRQQP